MRARSIFVVVREFWQMRIDFAHNLQTVKPKKLKLKLHIKINKNVKCVDFGDPRSRDCELRQKNIKTAILGLKS